MPCSRQPKQSPKNRLKLLDWRWISVQGWLYLAQNDVDLVVRNRDCPGLDTDSPANPNDLLGDRCFVPTHRNTQQQEEDHQGWSPHRRCLAIEPCQKVVNILPQHVGVWQQFMCWANHQSSHTTPIPALTRAPKLNVRHCYNSSPTWKHNNPLSSGRMSTRRWALDTSRVSWIMLSVDIPSGAQAITSLMRGSSMWLGMIVFEVTLESVRDRAVSEEARGSPFSDHHTQLSYSNTIVLRS